MHHDPHTNNVDGDKMIFRKTLFILGLTTTSATVFASCPFGADCKRPPCEASPEAPIANPGANYAPRFQPQYSAIQSAPYRPVNQAGAVYSPHVYGQPPCDPNATPPETKPTKPLIPIAKPPKEGEEDESTEDQENNT